MTEVPTIRPEVLSPDQRVYVIADNRLAEDSDWNVQLLKIELQHLSFLPLSPKNDSIFCGDPDKSPTVAQLIANLEIDLTRQKPPRQASLIREVRPWPVAVETPA